MISYGRQSISQDDINIVVDTLKSDYLTNGPQVEAFETDLCKYIGCKYSLVVNSGSSALDLAIRSLQLPMGSEIITTPFTYVATSNSIINSGMIPKFVDIEWATRNIEVTEIESKITDKTKAILFVDYAGHPCDIKELRRIADEYNLILIEDGAHSLGAEYEGRKVGTLADITIFSFHPVKVITCLPGKTRILVRGKGKGKGNNMVTTKSIENILVNDEVLSYDETNGIKEFDTVTKTFKNHVSSLLRVTLSNGNEITITHNHPIFVINNGWIKASSLEIGYKLLQYKYRSLGLRLVGLSERGKSCDEIYGSEKAKQLRNNFRENTIKRHKNPNDPFATKDWTKILIPKNPRHKATDKTKKILRDAQLKRWQKIKADPEKYNLFKEKIKIMNQDPEVKRKKREAALRLSQDLDYRKKISLGVRRAMETPEYWEHYIAGQNLKPNRAEIILSQVLDELCPGEFAYNGDYRLKTSVDRLIPDFININGKRKIIDLFGSYWHQEDEVNQRIERYKKHGFDALIIWDYELKNLENVKREVLNFLYNPNVEIVEIVNIEELQQEEDVYNIETEKNHNYFAYGILVHNCGEGGALVTNNQEYYNKAKLMRVNGVDRMGLERKSWEYDVLMPGFNYKMSDINAALGRSQLKRIDKFINARTKIADMYKLTLGEDIELPYTARNVKHAWHLFHITVSDRNKLYETLKEKGIQTQVHFIPIYRFTYYKNRFQLNPADFPYTEDVFREILSLPIYPDLKAHELSYIVETINDSLKHESITN